MISFAQNAKGIQSRQLTIDLFYVKMNRFVDSLFAATTRVNKCASGVSFVQFTINNRGEMRNIKTNEGTPGYLDTLLVNVLHKNNFNFKQAGLVNKTAILPVIYSFDFGCKVDTTKSGPFETLLKQLPDTIPDKSGYVYSLINMLNFKKTAEIARQGNFSPLNCILFSPLRMVKSVYY